MKPTNSSTINLPKQKDDWKINYGAGIEWAEYTTTTFQKLENEVTLNYSSEIGVFKYGAFGQVSKGVLSERLQLSLGARMDANNFNAHMANPLNQFSTNYHPIQH